MKKLDKSKPYGIVSGCDQGRVYEQDNVFFNGDGTEWADPDAQAVKAQHPAVVKSAASKKPAAPVKAVKTATESQVDDQLQG